MINTCLAGPCPRARDVNTNPAARGTPVAERTLRGDPIDVATGQVILRQDDVRLAGTLPITLSRTHISDYRLGGWFGESWSSTVDQRIEVEDDALHLVLADGTLLVYPIPVNGGEVLPVAGPRLPLRRVEGGYQVVDHDHALNFGAEDGDTYPIRSVVDGDGNRVVFRYDGTGNLVAIEHSGGYRLGVETTDGLITAFRLRGADLARFRYDRGRLVETMDGTRFTYDSDGRIVRWEDDAGRWYHYHFDGSGRVVRAEGTDGYLNLELAYDNGSTTVTNSLGHATRYQFDESLRVVAETNPLGSTTRYERDAHGRVLARTDGLGRVTRHVRDAAGNVLTTTTPDGRHLIHEYDEAGRLLTTIGPDGAVSRRVYDRRGRLVRTTDADDAVTTYTYDDAGNVDTITDPLGGVTRIESNAAGLPVRVADPVGAVTTYAYDGLGHPRRITEGSTVDPRGGTTTAEYGHFGLLLAQTRPDGGRVSYAYDTELRLVSVTNEVGLTWCYTYDPAGNLISETDYNGRTVRYGYDAAGQLVLRANGAGETVAFDRDAMGRVVRRRAGDDVATFTYDRAGRMTSARNADAEVVFTHDVLGRVTAESINGRTVRSDYDLAGRRTTRRTPSGAMSRFTYDAAGRPVALHTAGRTMAFEYDLGGRELVRRLPDVELRQSWDAADRLIAQSVRSGGKTVQHREYGYLPDGHLAHVADALSGPRTLRVDPAGRVLAVDGTTGRESYTYAPTGAVEHACWPGAATGGRRHYVGTLLAAAGPMVYAHDPQGRTTTRGDWHFQWNDDDRMTSVVTPEGDRWRYRYDALGRRIAKQRLDSSGRIVEQTQFTWDGTHLAEEVCSGPGTAVVLVWEWEPDTDRVVTQTRRVLGQDGTEFHAVVTDVLGAPTELVDESGKVAWHVRMSLWGKVLSKQGQAYIPLRFPGQYHDAETGLYYTTQRYYDPDAARYLSHDPLGLDPGPDSLAYVGSPTASLGLTPSASPPLPDSSRP